MGARALGTQRAGYSLASHGTSSSVDNEILARIAIRLAKPSFRSAMDVGCGTGLVLRALAKQLLLRPRVFLDT